MSTAGASFLGLIPATEPRIESLITGTASLLGHWLLFAAVVSYARFVVLDAQGLVAVVARAAKPREIDESENGSRQSNAAPHDRKPATSIFAAAGRSRTDARATHPAGEVASVLDAVGRRQPRRTRRRTTMTKTTTPTTAS